MDNVNKLSVRLYDEDAYLNSFNAVVMGCSEKDGKYEIILDRTAFFPEGGGQLADIGRIDTAIISDVQEKDGKIIHYADSPIEFGRTVNCAIDWERRFSFMQQHTGEHIVSGLVHTYYGYDNVGFHLGSEIVTMDYNGMLTDEDLRTIEIMANRAVADNIEVKTGYPSESVLSSLEYRSKKEIEGAIRIVEIPGVDVCACCAPHVKRTGEIGIIKLVNVEKYKQGCRVSMHCGFRALSDYNMKEEQVKLISRDLSSKESDIYSNVLNLKEEIAEYKSQINALQKELIEYKIDSFDTSKDTAVIFEKNADMTMLRNYANRLRDKGVSLVATFNEAEGNSFRYIVMGNENVKEISKKLNETFSGKGGGSDEMAQGSITATKEDIEKFFEK